MNYAYGITGQIANKYLSESSAGQGKQITE